MAAAGIVALKEMPEKLSTDHSRAKALALRLKELGVGIDLAQVRTNIICADLESSRIDADHFLHELALMGVKARVIDQFRFRMVLHNGIGDKDLDFIVEAAASVLEKVSR
jgi:threonine aldolase